MTSRPFGILQVIIQKLGANDNTKLGVVQYADNLMELFLRVFACRSATVHEEAMLAIGALAYAVGAGFAKYMPEFYKYVEMGLKNHEEYQVCQVREKPILFNVCLVGGKWLISSKVGVKSAE